MKKCFADLFFITTLVPNLNYMELLNRIDLSDVICFDIETARTQKELDKNSLDYESYYYTFKRDLKEGESIEDHYRNWAALYPEFARILCISVGRFYNGKIVMKTFVDIDEDKLLAEFNDYLYSFSTQMTRLGGHAVIQFDIPFVAKRMLMHRIRPHNLLDVFGKKPWDVEKTVIDTKKVWHCTSQRAMSLINIASAFGLPSPKDDIDGSMVGEVFWADPEGSLPRIAAYCEKDVITVANVLKCMKLEEPLEAISFQDLTIRKQTLLESIASGREVTEEDTKVLAELLASLGDESERSIGRDILISLTKDPSVRLTEEQINAIT